MRQKNRTENSPVQTIRTPVEHVGRRIDNFLLGYLGNIPKTRIYKMLRKGEVRINGKRIKPDYRLREGDTIRIPPFYSKTENSPVPPGEKQRQLLRDAVIYEDEMIIVLNKPAGMAVHSGSGERHGLIEMMRYIRQDDNLELVHRLDKPTSGCLLLARDHRVLRQLHKQLRDSTTEKYYLALLKGRLLETRNIEAALNKNVNIDGERKVLLDTGGKTASSIFKPVKHRHNLTLARIKIKTGRTHQIRVHAAAIGHPVAGDDKYGDRIFNRQMRHAGLKRMFLHAEILTITHPGSGKSRTFSAPLPEELAKLLNQLMNVT